MSEKASLLRRPRPPKGSGILPPVPSQRSLESTFLNQPPEIQVTDHRGDGTQSPVPTMQSEYDSNKYEKKKNQPKFNIPEIGDQPRGHKGLILPYKPRGPDPFPVRLPRQPMEVRQEYILPDDSFYKEEPEFRLADFLLSNKSILPPRPSIRKAILSRANYQKLTKMLQNAQFTDKQPQVTKIDLSDQAHLDVKHKRVPRRQLLLEMKKVIQERLEELGLTSPGQLGTSDKLIDVLDEVQDIAGMEGIDVKSQMCVFTKAAEKIFQGSKRSGSPFEGEEAIITPSELSILNCLMDGGFVLSLKAHFISEIPDLSPLSPTLIYLNLSFNELVEFPHEVLFCREIQVLKFRDNPLSNIPSDISRLQRLRTLILSFCCLTALPVSLFTIKSLEFLDVSYNKLTFLPREIKNLENLRYLNVEGNELPGLPCGLLRLNLSRVRIRNNFMSPLFWKENSTNSPQPLFDTCSLAVQKHFIQENTENYNKLPSKVAELISNQSRCDCCRGPLYGSGLRVIRPCFEIWGVNRIPFLFKSCSPTCCHAFIENTDPKVMDIIYGIDEKRP
ncbi:uncharacterized protein LOC143452165 [Clavelina lepadiformis]|uniref:uncharacterized protein LOC143452165 n=1 Tax=Clavelina lepadiformis TaxID=159417 RepID=UPI00404134CD